MIHEANPSAKTVLYETWGRKNGDPDNAGKVPEVATYEGDQARINNTYEQLAAALPATLAPVGQEWSIVRQSYPEIELYQVDGSHPAVPGTYLAACVFYDVLFNDRVTGATNLQLIPAQAKVLQQLSDQITHPDEAPSK